MRGRKVLIILLLSLIGVVALKLVLVEQLSSLAFKNDPKPGLILVASREGSLGAVSLELYGDKHFEFWNSGLIGMNRGAHGLYKISGDTLTLEPQQNGVSVKIMPSHRYVISDGTLRTIPEGTGLVFLGITLNKRTLPK
jgi:hypothetical protein